MSLSNNLIQELGLDALPEEKKISLLSAMTESVLKRITVEVLSRLSDEDQTQILAFQQNPPAPDVIETFLKTKIPDYDKIQETVVREFKDEMRSTMDMLKVA